MATIRDLISNRTIHYVQPGQTVFEAANYMVDCNVGAVPVLEPNDSTRTVLVAIGADLGVALAKVGTAAFTGVGVRQD